MKQCFAWWAFANRGVDNDALLHGARKIGFTGVELLPQELFTQAIDAGLEIVTHEGHTGIEQGLNDPANHSRIQNEVATNLALAERYRIPKLVVFSGNRRSGVSDSEARDHTIEGLRRLAPLAESTGMLLILELLNSKVDHPRYQCDNSDWAAGVIETVDSPNVRVLFDIYHAQIMEGDLIRTIQKHHAAFGHYHAAGNPGRHELDNRQEIFYPAVFQAIVDSGYNDYIGHEFIPRGNPLSRLQEAYRVLGLD